MFDRVVALKPDDAEAQFDRGFLLQELNDHDGAMAAFRQALAINPDHDRALYGLALSLISTRRPEEAIAPLKRNTKLQPMSPYGWYQLARVQHELGRPGETQKITRPSDALRTRRRAAARTGNGAEGANPGLEPGPGAGRYPARSTATWTPLGASPVALPKSWAILRPVRLSQPATGCGEHYIRNACWTALAG